jgi:LuxR family maltose regulon positive regulatory protein
VIRTIRVLLELARSRDADALAAFQAADRLAGRLAEPGFTVLSNRSLLVQTLVRLGETERAEQALAELEDQHRNDGLMRTSLAALRLAQHNPKKPWLRWRQFLTAPHRDPLGRAGWLTRSCWTRSPGTRSATGAARPVPCMWPNPTAR